MNKKIRYLLIIDSFNIAAFGLIGPIYAIFVEKIGGDILDTGLAFAVYSITLGIFSYILGKVGDRIKNEIGMIFMGSLISVAGFWGYLLVKNPFHLMLVQAALGIGQAMYNPMWDVIYSTNLDKGKKDSEWADWESMNYMVAGATSLLGAWIASFFGFRVLFTAMGLFSLISLLFIPQLKRSGGKS